MPLGSRIPDVAPLPFAASGLLLPTRAIIGAEEVIVESPSRLSVRESDAASTPCFFSLNDRSFGALSLFHSLILITSRFFFSGAFFTLFSGIFSYPVHLASHK